MRLVGQYARCTLPRFTVLSDEAEGSQTVIRDEANPGGRNAVDYYFIEEDGNLVRYVSL